MGYLIKIMPQILSGLTVTLELFAITLLLSLPLGVIVAVLRTSKSIILKKLSELYVLIMRGTPLLLQIIVIFYGLPILNIKFDRFPAAILAFVLNYAAYFGEIFRAGLQSVDSGQTEASKVLGFNKKQTFFKIILPQAIKKVVPPVANEITTLVKDTSLVYVVGLDEMLKIGKIAANRDVSLVPYIMVGVVYLLVIAILSKMLSKVEQKFDYYN
ncbi:amino acid ABC transporter permease [Clostridium sp. BJN0001]|uniref:amino acid ABC transporter permease n=1 Tax=Clostridium sp. BJN0001 TaxID=2930219 RepID=UPI001FD3BB08|nr:amino acid ABC transporter permease [Clostridium sp. BJN0001]